MKLLNTNLSPFASRVRLAIHAKSLPVEIAPAGMWLPNGQKSPDYLALNPIGKVPTLILDDGSALPESDTIVEYLADAFPQAGLRPARPQDAARGRLLARIFEQYVMAPGWSGLIGQLFAPSRDEAVVDATLAKIHEGLRHLSHFMTDEPFAVGDTITTADCALIPFLTFQNRLARFHGKNDPSAEHPRIAAYLDRVGRDPVVQTLLGEMRDGLVGSRLAMLLQPDERA
ncbi:Glutathione S-transferase [Nannocystis exedens]|uniref:Glutathione S-transferase n=1 Tax=Nannocystis exedens TaxID=54 RepID=A0A1I2GQI9_9BACT|nr:glutathione S-transferase family protein [Nannocystis exedens]PCC68730.1 Glutathione S-transferase [Nannocystis exedens]SFF19310.1 Glutathione S-transferase [Nannocystis exedens]